MRPGPASDGSDNGGPTRVAGPDNARSPEQYLHRGRICTYRWSNKLWNKVSVCFQQPRGVERIKSLVLASMNSFTEGIAWKVRQTTLDRKSTRLNSSH